MDDGFVYNCFLLLGFCLLLCGKVDGAISLDVHEITLDPAGSLRLSWALRPEGDIHFEVSPPLAEPYTWFALGFSGRGLATDSDYCVLWKDWKGHVHLQDTWSDADGLLHVDYQQDCISPSVVGGFQFSVIRKLDTCDMQDPAEYVIKADTTHIVWSRGRHTLISLSGLNVTSVPEDDKGMVRAQLVRAVSTGTASNDVGVSRLEVRAHEVKVPDVETTYWCHVHKLSDSLRKKHHVLEFQAVIQAGSEGLVHHMEVFHCVAPKTSDIPLYIGPCHTSDRPEATKVCTKVLAAWAMGAGPFVYPEEAGLPIGGPDFNLYVMLEIHYNNPGLKSDICVSWSVLYKVNDNGEIMKWETCHTLEANQKLYDFLDSSGMRFLITPSLRTHDAAIIELGLEYTDKMAIPPGQPEFSLSGYCVPECTAIGLPTEGITIFGSQLHTHLTGVRVYTKHLRNGRELQELNRDDHYSTHFQEIRLLQRRVKVVPGDMLITTCGYSTLDRTNVTLGGFSISDEMCVNYVHYFPASQLEVCKSAISDDTLATYFRFLREWEAQNTSAALGINDNYHSIEWTPLRIQMLSEIYNKSPLGMQCNTSSGDRFPGVWNSIPVPTVQIPLPPPTRMCSFD